MAAKRKKAPEVEQVEVDPSVAAMIESLTRETPELSHDEALELLEERGALAHVQQALLDDAENRSQPLAQRPVQAANPLRDGAGAGIFVDSTLIDDDDVPGTVLRVQRRPGAPLDEAASDEATFPPGVSRREALGDVELDDGHDDDNLEQADPFVLLEGVEPLVVEEDE